MLTTTLAQLIQWQSKTQFGKSLNLIPNQFEVYDVESKLVFTHYNDLDFLFQFAKELDARGWIEGTHFYFSQQPHTTRLNLLNGNLMVEYDEFHEWIFNQRPMPPLYDGLIIYLKLISLINKNSTCVQLTINMNIENLTVIESQSAINLVFISNINIENLFLVPVQGIAFVPDSPEFILTII